MNTGVTKSSRMDSQSLRGDVVVASLILHCTGWSVSTSTVMVFPSTLGLSLISLTADSARWVCKRLLLSLSLDSVDSFQTSYTTKWCSSVPCLGGWTEGARSISLPAMKTFRMFLSSPEDISKKNICEYILSPCIFQIPSFRVNTMSKINSHIILNTKFPTHQFKHKYSGHQKISYV